MPGAPDPVRRERGEADRGSRMEMHMVMPLLEVLAGTLCHLAIGHVLVRPLAWLWAAGQGRRQRLVLGTVTGQGLVARSASEHGHGRAYAVTSVLVFSVLGLVAGLCGVCHLAVAWDAEEWPGLFAYFAAGLLGTALRETWR